MPGITIRVIVIGLAMLAASGLAVAMKPTQRMADIGPKIDLETMIPKEFGDWRVDTTVVPVQISPDVQAKLDKIYNQTLSRTYINSRGERIMLSVAYGGDQSDSMQVHRPEVCYPAQGFQVVSAAMAKVATDFGELPVKRLLTRLGQRNEPVTYWIVVGDRIATRGIEQKFAQLKYGFTGQVPDGMLVRVSAIDADAERSYQVQDAFVRSLLSSVDGRARAHIAGALGS
jgi:EpsI family protein